MTTTTTITVEANEAELELHAQATVRLSAADAYRIAERLLATTEDSLRALVKAADAEVSSRLAGRNRSRCCTPSAPWPASIRRV